jgi:hypothetical protein
MAPDSLRILYANQMAPHARFGYALYEPPLSKDLKPGAVGYFDASGSWNPILQLSDGKAVQSAGYVEIKEKLKSAQDENIAWGPKCSSGMRGVMVDLKASAKYVTNAKTSSLNLKS